NCMHNKCVMHEIPFALKQRIDLKEEPFGDKEKMMLIKLNNSLIELKHSRRFLLHNCILATILNTMTNTKQILPKALITLIDCDDGTDNIAKRRHRFMDVIFFLHNIVSDEKKKQNEKYYNM
ncbi:ATP binding protein, partial [Loa loa]